jgi:hypothetical protein
MSDLAELREARLAAGGYVKGELAREFFDAKGEALDPEKDRLCLNGLIAELDRLERQDKKTRTVQYDIFGKTVPLDYEMAVPVAAAGGDGGEEPEAATVEHRRHDMMLWGEFVAHVGMVLAQIASDQERVTPKVEIMRYGRAVGARDDELLVTVLARLRPH